MSNAAKFEEKQSLLSNPLLWMVFAFSIVMLLWGFSKDPAGFQLNNTTIYPLCIVFLGFGWVFMMRLSTAIDEVGIRFRFNYLPFAHNDFKWEDVKLVHIITYNPWFTGYGLRLLTRWGIVYNTKGRQGLQIILNNGKPYLVGTQQAIEMQTVLKELGKE